MERSAAIRKIEQDMMELGRLYQEVAELVHQQEPAVEQINEGAQDVQQNVANANKQMDTAIDSARKARKWKWYALIIISESRPSAIINHANAPSHYHCYCRWCCSRCHPSQFQQVIDSSSCILFAF